MTEDIQIDKEFAALIPQLSQEERRQLEENIVEHGGARDPLVVWRIAPDEISESAQELIEEGAEVNKCTDQEISNAAKETAGEGDRGWPDCCVVGRTEHWALVQTTGHRDGDGGKYGSWRDYDWFCVYTGEKDFDSDQMVLLDGHNRFEICTRLGLPFEVSQVSYLDRSQASDWIDRNQLGRRNLHPDAFTLLLGRRYNRAKKQAHRPDKSVNVTELSGVTAERLAKEHGVTEKTVRNAGKFAKSVEKAKAIDPAIEAKVSSGKGPTRAAVVKAAALLDKSPERAREIIDGVKKMSDVIREDKRAEVVAKLENLDSRKVKELAGHYDVIVIDPPWPMEKIERDVTPEQVAFEYPTMQEEELSKMTMPAAGDCHLWMWTTHRFLPMSLRLLDAWGFKYVCTFVWHKPGGFQPFGLPQYNCEFAVYARRGTPQFIDTKAFPVCFDASRGKHSEKPEAFYDVVRRVTAGRRIDIFNRRKIQGFEVWGNESDL